MGATSSHNFERFRHGAAAMAIPAYPVHPRHHSVFLEWRDSIFVIVYQLAFQLMEWARRCNY